METFKDIEIVLVRQEQEMEEVQPLPEAQAEKLPVIEY